jgi:DNA-damage-inducible protein J
MAKTASMYIRVDPQVKADVEAIYAQFGMSVTDAINIFLYQSRYVGGLPFDLRLHEPNVETREAIEEAERIAYDPNVKSYKNFSELLEEVLAEDDTDV